MAPRGRRRKVGLGRIDAALDAMRPLGFSDEIVRKSVKDLLDVYGNDGWAFIEEAAYKVLVDTLLEEQEQTQDEQQQFPEENCTETYCVEQMLDKHICERQERVEDIYDAEIFDKVLCEQEKGQEENFEAENCSALKDDVPQTKLGVQIHLASDHSPPMMECLPPNRRRRPCYGWISDDEDEDDDFVLSTPARCVDP
ncbi:unnamed protein product [Ilex paraguariensis]|uniref:WIYLD domain-containing protein n=1 Tax=Ilex paraguariensis TaxID=185542 RepID=A0ABC8QW36_9AQUA